MPKLDRISVVLAIWCPHCVPLSLENVEKMASDLHVPFRVLDIDHADQEKIGDELVKKYGDNTVDYIIPQVFGEFSDGSVRHILTGSSEGVPVTKQRWENFFLSNYYNSLKSN